MISFSWGISPAWDWLVIFVVLIVVGGLVFWRSNKKYQSHYSMERSLKLAILRTTGWILVYGSSFVLIFWLVSQQLPTGWLRYLVAGLVWWLLAEMILAPAWRFFDRLFETW